VRGPGKRPTKDSTNRHGGLRIGTMLQQDLDGLRALHNGGSMEGIEALGVDCSENRLLVRQRREEGVELRRRVILGVVENQGHRVRGVRHNCDMKGAL